jgi:Holliday junction resolvase RusA-like endonuclease
MMIAILVPGEPVGQPRQRFRIVRYGTTPRIRPYQDPDHPVHAYKRAIQLLAKSVVSSPLAGPAFGIDVLAVFHKPLCRDQYLERIRKVTKPDGDNVLKAVMDALTGIVWSDDCKVSDKRLRMREAARGEESHTLIRVRELPLSLGKPTHVQKALFAQ